MSITKRPVRNHVFISVLLVTVLRPAAMNAASESDRLERLEHALWATGLRSPQQSHSGWTSLRQIRTLYTIERTLPTGAITPDRQIGVELWGTPFTKIWPEQKDLLTYYAGIFNGNGQQHHRNDNNNFMFAGRLELQPFTGNVFG